MRPAKGNLLSQLQMAENPLLALRNAYITDKEEVLALKDSYKTCTEFAEAIGIVDEKGKRQARRVFTPDRSRAYPEDDGTEQALCAAVQAYVQKRRGQPVSITELCEHVDRSPSTVRGALGVMREHGFEVETTDDRAMLRASVPEQDRPVVLGTGDQEYRFGVISDTHYGSTACAQDFIGWIYDRFLQEGIKHVLNCGDVTEGPGVLGYRGHANEVRPECMDWRGVLAYTHSCYPRQSGITTYAIDSSKSHGGWQYARDGRVLLRLLADGVPEQEDGFSLPPRKDIVYLGLDEADVQFGPLVVRLFHPDGGVSYARSYHVQKFIEAMPGGTKPNLFLVGHYHTEGQFTARNVVGILVPGCQWQTTFFRRYGREPVVGAYIITARADEHGSLRKLTTETFLHYHMEDRFQPNKIKRVVAET